MNIHIQHGQLLDCAQNTKADLFISAGKIVGVGIPPDSFVATHTLDARNCLVLPGIVDLCARLREPGEEYKATLVSELTAAVAGGVTSLACPPDTDPVLDEPGLVKMLKHRTEQLHLAHVYPMGALSYGLKGLALAEMSELSAAGCIGFAQAHNSIIDTRVLWHAFEYAATFGFTLFLHAEEPFLGQDGVAHAGEVASRLGLNSVPVSAETLALARLVHIANKTGARLHIHGISSAEGVAMLRIAKQGGVQISADTSAHHLHFTDHDIGYFNSNYHIKPPLRSMRDRDALRAGLLDGTLDAIASHHTPVDDDAKLMPFTESEFGASGLETLLALSLKWGVEDNLDLRQLLALITQAPAKILGIVAGELSIDRVADICIIDTTRDWHVCPASLKSQGKNSPCLGMRLAGVVRYTLVNGQIVYADSAQLDQT